MLLSKVSTTGRTAHVEYPVRPFGQIPDTLKPCRDQVEFVPADDRMYSLKMAVRVASTTKHAAVVLQGRVSFFVWY